MENFKNIKSSESEELTAKFNKFFPEGKIKEISIKDLPADVLKSFEGSSKRFILPEDYKPGDFKKIFLVEHDNGDLTYIGNQIKNYWNESTEDLSYLFERRGQEKIGHGELRYDISSDDEFFKNKPFVGFTETEKEYHKTGLGRRRLFLLNALAQSLYDQPLYSSTLIADEARSLWEKLVVEGKAEKFKEGDDDRYVMKK
jgi:hypothetical protein